MAAALPTASHPLYLLPRQIASAAENMAMDWLLLESFPHPPAPRLRFYGWAQTTWTFGYGQLYAEARKACGAEVDLIRRPTGGGLVDHRQDWTYALVLPPEHPLAQARACESYRTVHEALAAALQEAGLAGCELQDADCAPSGSKSSNRSAPSVCFVKSEKFDLVRTDDGRKIAGAAQKRAREGLLFQGSVNRLAAPEIKDWECLGDLFAHKLGETLGAKPEKLPEELWTTKALGETTARFASIEWNQKR